MTFYISLTCFRMGGASAQNDGILSEHSPPGGSFFYRRRAGRWDSPPRLRSFRSPLADWRVSGDQPDSTGWSWRSGGRLWNNVGRPTPRARHSVSFLAEGICVPQSIKIRIRRQSFVKSLSRTACNLFISLLFKMTTDDTKGGRYCKPMGLWSRQAMLPHLV